MSRSEGALALASLLDISADDWHTGFDLVLHNTVRMARLVTPVMTRQGSGAIMGVSAFGAVEPSLDFPVSSALRTDLGAFVTRYTERHGPAGIHMNSVLPGYIDTYEVDAQTQGGMAQWGGICGNSGRYYCRSLY